jgi:hypothetical protein
MSATRLSARVRLERRMGRVGVSLTGWDAARVWRLLLILFLIGVGRALHTPRRSSKAADRAPTNDLDAVADVVVARLEVANRQTARVRRRAVLLASSLLVVAGVVFLPSRPAAWVNVRTDAPRQVALIGLADRPPVEIDAHLGAMSVTAEAANRRALGASDIFRLRLPATRARCRRMAEQLGGTCGEPGTPTKDDGSTTTLQFSGMVRAGIDVDGGRGLRFDTADGSATAALDAEVATLTVECVDRTNVTITNSGRETDPVPLACLTDNERWVWRTLSLPTDSLTVMGLYELRTIEARATGNRSVQTISDGVLQVDDEDEVVRSEQGRKITVRSQRGGTELNVLGDSDTKEIVTRVEARAASSVLAEGDERLPTEFTRHSDLYLALVGVVASLLATVGVDALVRSK